jgi:Trk K+ transport system NAD-binding subunit
VQPLMVDFLDSLSRQGQTRSTLLAEFVIEGETAHLAGTTLAEAFEGLESCRVLGIERAGGGLDVAPGGSAVLQVGDRLIIHGAAADLEHLRARGIRRNGPLLADRG